MSMASFNRTSDLIKKSASDSVCLRGYWGIYNELQNRLYQRKGGKELEENLMYFREQWIGSQESCLNLFPLIEETARKQKLWDIACSYLEKLYAPILPKQKKTIKKILELLLNLQQEALLEEKALISLFEITLPDSDLQELYYKMLCGTNPYNCETSEGLPPLHEIVFFKKNRAPILFRYAPPVLLEEVLGKDNVAAIIEKEKEKLFDKETKEDKMRNAPLSKKELQSIMDKAGKTWSEEKKQLLNFERQSNEKRPISWVDATTKRTLKYFPYEQKKIRKNSNSSEKKTNRSRN